jgi:molybdate transport system regulatory protein
MGHKRATPGRERLELRSKVWLELGGKVVLSDWRVRLLEAIDETGSLANAAKALDVPYRTAWYKLREVEDRLGLRLLETQSGGADGGGSRLTSDARELVARFRRASAGLDEQLDRRLHAEFGDRLDSRGESP